MRNPSCTSTPCLNNRMLRGSVPLIKSDVKGSDWHASHDSPR
jgi:hypothetical protein